jgi:hypothetical protein
VFNSSALHSRWLLLLKIEISSIGKDLNVIFYQNMPNLHNRYKSAERKISQKNPEYMLKSSSLCLYSSNFGTFWLKIEQF